jgi:hypothetical protein
MWPVSHIGYGMLCENYFGMDVRWSRGRARMEPPENLWCVTLIMRRDISVALLVLTWMDLSRHLASFSVSRCFLSSIGWGVKLLTSRSGIGAGGPRGCFMHVLGPRKESAPPAELEPAIFGLEMRRLVHCIKGATRMKQDLRARKCFAWKNGVVTPVGWTHAGCGI